MTVKLLRYLARRVEAGAYILFNLSLWLWARAAMASARRRERDREG